MIHSILKTADKSLEMSHFYSQGFDEPSQEAGCYLSNLDEGRYADKGYSLALILLDADDIIL